MSMLLNPYRYGAGGGGGGDPYWSNVVLLSGFEGADGSASFTDESSYARTITAVGSAQIDTAQSKYGASSLLCASATSDGITCADSADFEIGSGSFTVEGFFRFNTVVDCHFISHNDVSGNGWSFRRESGALSFSAGATGTTEITWTPVTGQWYHLAADIDFAAAIARIYVDGTMLQKTTGRSFPATNGATVLAIGKEAWRASRYLNGHADEIRITKGVARYASDSGFTVPASAYPRS